jgi:S-DNA-T family DNA segregation ATPase FtsK/SpoIIIE
MRIIRYQFIFASALFYSFLVYLLLHSSLPNNAFVISSDEQAMFGFTYYLSTGLAYINYFTGPWIIPFYIVYSFFYYTVFRKRVHWTDHFQLFVLMASVLGICYIFFPHSLGDGIYFLLRKKMQQSVVVMTTFVTLISAIYICVNDSFISDIARIRRILQSISNFAGKLIHPFVRAFYQAADWVRGKLNKTTLKHQVSTLLKGEDRVPLPARTYEWQPIKEVEEAATEEIEEQFEIEEEVDNVTGELLPVPAKKKRAKKKSDENQVSFFTSNDLIDSITVGSAKNKNVEVEDEYFEQIIEAIETKLTEFKITGNIINVLKGPVVDTFELELGTGVKVSKVNSISKDLSLALCGAPIRIVYPMRGKSTIGIEVPRNPREIIYLDEVLKSPEYNSTHYRLPIAMGKNAFGEPFIADLASMPHMLVAGATGAGKSVFINTLLVSLLIKMSPEKLKLILIDPKQLELALYQDLPHLLLPVMTESKNAAMSLLWACQEMERRYSILKEMGVRNIDAFNQKVNRVDNHQLEKISQHYSDDVDSYELPYIVIIVDEFADLILTKMGKDIEINICRLAAKARAAGIHLVLATQRPSVDVITGLIKANFPTRVSFRVTSPIDSRTILNAQGAEMLLGMGDMLYKHGSGNDETSLWLCG